MSQKQISDKRLAEDRSARDGSHKTKSGRYRDSRHTSIDERHTRSESKSGSNKSSNGSERYDRNDRHYRRQDIRSNTDTNDRSRRRDFSSSDHNSDRRDGHRRDERRDDRPKRGNESRSRSRSRSRERHSNSSSARREDTVSARREDTVSARREDTVSARREETVSARREDTVSRTKSLVTNEKPIIETKPEKGLKGLQHKNSLEIMRQQIQVKTGIAVPEYYNPGVVNPIKFAEQEQKRKLLWSRDEKKPEEKKCVTTSCVPNPWKDLKFEGEKGNQMTEKFRKLMGIKDKANTSSDLNTEDNSQQKSNESAIESQETLFRNLDMQYAIARISTHTQRGVGLGFGVPQHYAANPATSATCDRQTNARK